MECREMDLGRYNGETYRPVGDKFIEHYRTANSKNPTAESYKEKPFAKHRFVHNPQNTGEPELKLDIVARASNMDRKIKDARAILANRLILANKPD